MIVVLPLLIAMAATAGVVAQDTAGPDEDSYVPLVRPNDVYDGSADAMLRTTMSANLPVPPVDTTRITSIDPNGFPDICTFVEVLDENGNPIGGFDADSFCVFQDGVQIDSFSVVELHADECPTSICLVIDVSGSMNQEGKLTAAKAAASAFVRQMDVLDRVAIVKFSDCYSIVQTFTNDTTLLLSKISTLASGGFTAALDGIWAGTDLTVPEVGSKAVIALSDGMENRSQWCSAPPDGLTDGNFADDSTIIVNLAKSGSVPIFTISLGNTFDPQYLIGLANGSGGDYYHAPTGGDIQGIYEAIKFRLCSRYLICYASPDSIPNGDCHTVQICQETVAGDCVNCDTTSYCEPDNPRITLLTNPDCVRWDQDFEICAKVIDSDTPPESLTVKLFYRLETNVAYTEVLLAMENDSVWCGTIPGAVIDCDDDTIYAYLTAADDRVTVTHPAGAPTTVHKIPVCPNLPPVCQDPSDTTIVFCDGDEICLPVGCSDPDGNLDGGPVQVYGPGAIANGFWCYEPKASEKFLVGFVCNDSCRIKDCEAEFEVTLVLNEPPVCSLTTTPAPPLCVPPVHVLNYVSVDPNGDALECTNTNPNATIDNGVWQYSPAPGETVYDTIRCTDVCGNTCEIPIEITFPNPQPVTCDFDGKDTTIFMCEAALDSIPVSSSIATFCEITSGPGVLRGGYWVYQPTGDQTVEVGFRCVTLCDTCEGSFTVRYEINEPPVCEARGDTSFFLCEPAEICIPIYGTDPDGNLMTCEVVSTSVVGRVTNGLQPAWCYEATTDEILSIITRCVDSCGAECLDTFQVTIDVNEAPVCEPHNDTTIFLCEPGQVCIDLKATDADGNLSHCYPAGTVHEDDRTIEAFCIYAERDTSVLAIGHCVDACGAFCEDTFRVTIIINDDPVCTLPGDTSIFLCEVGPVSLPAFAIDPNGNLDTCVIVEGPGVLENGYWTYTPAGDETVVVTILCEDSCDAQCRGIFTVDFDVNEPPVCQGRADTSIFLCQPAEICIPIYGTDADGNLEICEVVSTSVVGRIESIPLPQWCYQATTDEILSVVTRCVDSCGAECLDTFQVTINVNEPPVCDKQADTNIYICEPQTVCIPLGGTDADGNLLYCGGIGPAGARTEGDPNQYCFFADRDTTFWAHFRCWDQCEAFCEDSFMVTVNLNEPPVCTIPNDSSYLLCDTATICFDWLATDNDGEGYSAYAELLQIEPTGIAVPDTFQGNFCVLFEESGLWRLIVSMTDPCGESCADTSFFEITVQDGPSCRVPNDLDTTICEPGLLRLPFTADPVADSCYIVSGPGKLNDGAWEIDAVENTKGEVVIRCENECGFCEDTFQVAIRVNSGPVCTIPDDTTYYFCEADTLCVPFEVIDPDGNLSFGIAVLQQILPAGNAVPDTFDGTLCLPVEETSRYQLTVYAIDSCGLECADTSFFDVFVNTPPVCQVPTGELLFFQCAPEQVCVDVGCTDADGNLIEGVPVITAGVGEIVNGQWCYTPPAHDTIVVIQITCTDSCGASSDCFFTVKFDINEPPVCNVPNDTTIFLCEPQLVCLPLSGTDGDNNFSYCYPVFTENREGQSLSEWCYFADHDTTLWAVFACLDQCGATCTDSFEVTIKMNNPPVCSIPGDTTILICDTATFCFDFFAGDPDGNGLFAVAILSELSPTASAPPETLLAGTFCQTFDETGTWMLTIYIQDSCGEVCADTSIIEVARDDAPVCSVPADLDTVLCEPGLIRLPFEDVGDTCFVVSGPGKIEEGAWVYDATENLKGEVVIRCESDCGFCEDTFQVEIRLNEAPVCTLPDDTTYFFCDADTLCVPFEVIDPDGNLNFAIVILQRIDPEANAKPDTFSGELCLPALTSGLYRLTSYADDSCGLSCTDTAFFNVTVNTPPQVTCGEDKTFECDFVGGFDDAEWFDLEGGTLTTDVTTDSIPGNCAQSYRLVRTWIVTDSCGAADTCSQAIDVLDTTPPVLFCREDNPPPNCPTSTGNETCDTAVTVGHFTVEFDSVVYNNIFYYSTWYYHITWDGIPADLSHFTIGTCDTLSGDDLLSSSPPGAGLGPDGSTGIFGVKWETPDGIQANVALPFSFTIAGLYNVAPVDFAAKAGSSDNISSICGPSMDCDECDEPTPGPRPVFSCDDPLVINAPQVFDNCDPEPIVRRLSTDSIPGGCPQSYELTVVWEAIDHCGNADTCEQTYVVVDTTAPVISCPPDTTIECGDLDGDFGTATADDNCDPDPIVRLVDVDTLAQEGQCYYQIVRKFLAMDHCENVSDTCYQTITVGDVTDPVCSVPSDTSFFICDAGTEICLDVYAEDNCDDSVLCVSVVTSGNLPEPVPVEIVDGKWCWTATVTDELSVEVTCTDNCGNTCTRTFAVSITVNQPPVCETPNDTTIALCQPAEICIPLKGSDVDGNFLGCSVFEPGQLFSVSGDDEEGVPVPGDQWCYYAEHDTVITVHFRCWDQCEAFCEDSFVVTITVGSDPVCSVPNDTTIFLCDTATICLPYGAIDADGNPVSCWVVGDEDRTQGGDEWCYFFDHDTTLQVVIHCENECGSCEDTFKVTVDLNSPPVVIPLPDREFVLCGPDTICLGPWPKIDDDDNWVRNFAPFGWLDSPFLCFEADTAGIYTVILCIEDECGAVACDTVLVKVSFNRPPVCTVPKDTTIYLCAPERVCLPIYSSDPDGDITFCKTYTGFPDARTDGNECKGDCPKDLWCYTPQGDEVVNVLVVCTDTCGNFCEGEFTVTFVMNEDPVCELPNDTTIFLCEEGEVSLPVGAIDLDGNLKECSVVSGGGSIVDGFWVYYADVAETLSVVIACVDSCGAECRGQFEVIFEANLPPICEYGELSPPQCVPAQLVVPIFSTDPEGGTVVCSLVDGPGEVIDNVWQWEPIPGVTDTVYIRCTDSCGAYCEINFVVSIPNPQPPTCVVPVEDQSFFLCQPGIIELDVYAIGGDSDSITCEIVDGPGSLAGGKWSYNASQTESFDVTVRCTNQCGAYCEATFTVDIRVNSAPECDLPKDQQIFQCEAAKISLPVSATDIDGNLDQCVIISGPGEITGGNWSFTPTGSGDYRVTIACYDSCEASCEGTFLVQVRINEGPRCVIPNDTTIAQCTPTQVALPVSAIFYEPDFGKGGGDRGGRTLNIPSRPVSKRDREVRPNAMGNLAAGVTQNCQVVSGPGTISGGYWYYTPVGDESFCVTVRCTDECGATCEETFCVNFIINDAPVCSFQAPSPGQCTPAIIAVPFQSTDPEGGPLDCEIISGPGTLNDHVWQYEPIGGESFSVKIRCTDTCGAFCDIDFNINVPNPQPPICVLPTTTVDRFLCGPGQVTVPVSSTGGTGQVNCEVISGQGQIINGQWVLNVTQPGQYSVTVQCTDACGETCQGTFYVNVTFNSAPQCQVEEFVSVSGCEGAEVSTPVSAFDPDGNLEGCEVYSGPGEIIGGEWVWEANSEGEYQVTIRCYDECGAECYSSFYVSVDLNEPPACNLDGEYYFQGCDQVRATIPINAYDPDGNLRRCVKKTGIGSLVNGVWSYTASTSGTYSVVIECTDSCGATSLCEFSVTFDLNDPPICNLRDTTIVVCGAIDIVLPLPSFDPDGNLAGCTLLSGPGSIIGHEWYYHLLEDTPVDLVIRCVDECGMECVSTWHIEFQFEDVLDCDFEMPSIVYLCGPGEFCFDVPAGCEVEAGLVKVDGVTMCFEATEEGTYWADITCADACGNECTRRAYFEVIFTDLPDCGPSIISGRTTTPDDGATASGADVEPCDCPVRGDLSGEGEVTSLDLSLLISVLQQETMPSYLRYDPTCPIDGRADVNCDGVVDIRDAEDLTQFLFHAGKAPCGRCSKIGQPVTPPRDR